MHRRQAPHPCMVTSTGVPSGWTHPFLALSHFLVPAPFVAPTHPPKEKRAGGLLAGWPGESSTCASAAKARRKPRSGGSSALGLFSPAVLHASPCGAKCGCTGVGHTGGPACSHSVRKVAAIARGSCTSFVCSCAQCSPLLLPPFQKGPATPSWHLDTITAVSSDSFRKAIHLHSDRAAQFLLLPAHLRQIPFRLWEARLSIRQAVLVG